MERDFSSKGGLSRKWAQSKDTGVFILQIFQVGRNTNCTLRRVSVILIFLNVQGLWKYCCSRRQQNQLFFRNTKWTYTEGKIWILKKIYPWRNWKLPKKAEKHQDLITWNRAHGPLLTCDIEVNELMLVDNFFGHTYYWKGSKLTYWSCVLGRKEWMDGLEPGRKHGEYAHVERTKMDGLINNFLGALNTCFIC